MRSARVLSAFGLVSLLAAIGCSSNESSEFGSASQGLGADPILNEVVFNVPSIDQFYEWVELKGTPCASLAGYQLAYIKGDSGQVGNAIAVFSLAGATNAPDCGADGGSVSRIGSTGLFMLRSASGHPLPPGTSFVNDPGFDASGGILQNGTGTVILVKGASLTQGSDYDTNDDGVLDLPANAVLVDAVAITDNGAGDRTYGPVVGPVTSTSAAASRFLDDHAPLSSAAWYGGTLAGSVSTGLAYSMTTGSAVMPASAALTPGAPNLPRPLAVDGGAVTDAGSVQDASVSTDAGVAADGGSAAVDAGSAADASSPQDASLPVDAGPGIDASFPPTTSDPYLNEIEFNPGGTDNPYEYIELKGVAGASLAGYQVVYVEGDSTSTPGSAVIVFPLGSASLGSAGFAVLKSGVGGHAIPSGATVIGDNAFDANNGVLQNGTGTFLLVRGGAFVQGTDYDTNDDGTLELPAGSVIVDAIAVSDGGASDKAYAPTVATSTGVMPAAISRLVGNTARSAAASWFGATLSGANTSLAYDASPATANMPAGAVLTPGAENAQGSPAPVDAGAPVVDAGPRDAGTPVVDAGPRDAGTPVVDAGARDAGTPVVDAGARDAGATTTDAGARDAGAPAVDAGVRDAGTLPAEQTFGEGEGGCGCAVVGSERRSTQPLAWVAFGGFALLAARRRRR